MRGCIHQMDGVKRVHTWSQLGGITKRVRPQEVRLEGGEGDVRATASEVIRWTSIGDLHDRTTTL